MKDIFNCRVCCMYPYFIQNNITIKEYNIRNMKEWDINIKKRYFFLLFLSLFLLDLGRLLDVTVSPEKSDIIVYLGGGLSERAQKSIQLYQKGYAKTGKIIYTGAKYFFHEQYFGRQNLSVDKKRFFTQHGLRPEQLIYHNASNTMKEVKFVKAYMLKHGLHSVLFVTDPPHSRRVSILAGVLAGYGDSGIRFAIVGSGVKWWNPSYYYLTKEGTFYALLEAIKIPHNLLAYGVLERYGLLTVAEEKFGPVYQQVKRFFLSLISRVWK